MSLIALSCAAWANLGFALDVHGRYLRDVHGVALPAELEQLRVHAWKVSKDDTQGQPGQSLAEFVDRLQSRPVMQLAYTYADAAAMLGVSVRTVKRMVAEGKLPAVHINGSVRIRLHDLQTYLEGLAPTRPLTERIEVKTGTERRPSEGSTSAWASPTPSTPGAA